MKRMMTGFLAIQILAGIPGTSYGSAIDTNQEMTLTGEHYQSSIQTWGAYDNYALRPRAAARRAAIHRAVPRSWEGGLFFEFVDSNLDQSTEAFDGNFILLGLQRRFRHPFRNFYVGGRIAGGVYTADETVQGGIGYSGLISGFELGRKPLRVAVGSLIGFGLLGISQSHDEMVSEIFRGVFILEPEIKVLLSITAVSTLALKASYQYMPASEVKNIGGPSIGIEWIFSRPHR